jgi:hypothetical protein
MPYLPATFAQEPPGWTIHGNLGRSVGPENIHLRVIKNNQVIYAVKDQGFFSFERI